MAKKLLKENSVVQIGKYEAKIIKSSTGWYLFTCANKENSILFSQFGINKEDLINKFNLIGDGIFPYCDTLKKLTEIIEYLQSLYSIEDNGVFDKFPIGSIVVSMSSKNGRREKGDIFRVLEKSKKEMLYYKSQTYSSDRYSWRLATKWEEEAYKNGIKNIEEIKYESVSLNPETDYFIVNSQQEYNQLLNILHTLTGVTGDFYYELTVTETWKYVVYRDLEQCWSLSDELLSTHERQLSINSVEILKEKKETHNTQINNKPINKLEFNHKNKEISKIKLSTL